MKISPGKLIYKIKILEIKSKRIDDKDSLVHIRNELDILTIKCLENIFLNQTN